MTGRLVILDRGWLNRVSNHGRTNADFLSFAQPLTCKDVTSKNSSPMNTDRHSDFPGKTLRRRQR